MASAQVRAEIASKAAILSLWKGEDSYVVVTQELEAEKAKAMKQLCKERDNDQKTYLQGFICALDFALDIPQRSFIEHNRQVEASHG